MPNKKLIVSLFHIPKLTVAYAIHVLESYQRQRRKFKSQYYTN